MNFVNVKEDIYEYILFILFVCDKKFRTFGFTKFPKGLWNNAAVYHILNYVFVW